MIEGGDGAGFTQEAIRKLVRAELDRHFPMQPGVDSLPAFSWNTICTRPAQVRDDADRWRSIPPVRRITYRIAGPTFKPG
jgi:hypothetical protein